MNDMTKIVIKSIADSEEKARITANVMESLFDWQPSREEIERRSLVHMSCPFFAAFDGEEAVGFCAVRICSESVAEVHTIGVFREYRRLGIGSSLVETVQQYCKGLGFAYLTVKVSEHVKKQELCEMLEAFFDKNSFVPGKSFRDLGRGFYDGIYLAKYLGN